MCSHSPLCYTIWCGLIGPRSIRSIHGVRQQRGMDPTKLLIHFRTQECNVHGVTKKHKLNLWITRVASRDDQRFALHACAIDAHECDVHNITKKPQACSNGSQEWILELSRCCCITCMCYRQGYGQGLKKHEPC